MVEVGGRERTLRLMKSWPIFSSSVIASMVLRTQATAASSRWKGFAVRSTMSPPDGCGNAAPVHAGRIPDAQPVAPCSTRTSCTRSASRSAPFGSPCTPSRPASAGSPRPRTGRCIIENHPWKPRGFNPSGGKGACRLLTTAGRPRTRLGICYTSLRVRHSADPMEPRFTRINNLTLLVVGRTICSHVKCRQAGLLWSQSYGQWRSVAYGMSCSIVSKLLVCRQTCA